ncbi:LacI family DNA-binding transcriptional regulator [Streptomyces sp. NPDC054796]
MTGSRRPTLTDVARRVGISAKTVSRVLNGDGPVSDATREKVLAAVSELGFRPNLMARNMRVGGRDSTVGLIVPEIANPFFSTVAGGIEEAVRDRGLTLLLGSSDEDAAKERTLVNSFLARRVSVLLIAPAHGADHRFLRREREGGLPLVFLDRPAAGLAADSVVSANMAGAREGTAHLLAHGHRRIGFLGDLPGSLYTRRERFRGYRAALAEADVPYDRALVAEAHDAEAAGAATHRLLALDDPPTALFTANNLASLGALPALAAAGRRDVAIVGFDDLPLASVLEPGLTVVAQDPVAMGRTAAELALSRLDGHRGAARTTTVPVRLVRRGSAERGPTRGAE